MPLYEFRCATCGNAFEELVRNAADQADLKCPVCGSANPQRLLSATFGGGSGESAASGGGGGGGGCGGGHGGFS